MNFFYIILFLFLSPFPSKLMDSSLFISSFVFCFMYWYYFVVGIYKFRKFYILQIFSYFLSSGILGFSKRNTLPHTGDLTLTTGFGMVRRTIGIIAQKKTCGELI